MAKKKKTDLKPRIEFPQKYKVVSADFSLRRPGFCQLFLEKDGEDVHIVGMSTSNVDNKTAKKTHGQLLTDIGDALLLIMRSDPLIPTYFVREKAFNSRAAMSLIGIFKVVGIADVFLQAKQDGAEWFEVYPVSVKKLVTGDGKADKNKVASALSRYVGNWKYACDDLSDATAVAIGWLIDNGQIKFIDLESEQSENVEQ